MSRSLEGQRSLEQASYVPSRSHSDDESEYTLVDNVYIDDPVRHLEPVILPPGTGPPRIVHRASSLWRSISAKFLSLRTHKRLRKAPSPFPSRKSPTQSLPIISLPIPYAAALPPVDQANAEQSARHAWAHTPVRQHPPYDRTLTIRSTAREVPLHTATFSRTAALQRNPPLLPPVSKALPAIPAADAPTGTLKSTPRKPVPLMTLKNKPIASSSAQDARSSSWRAESLSQRQFCRRPVPRLTVTPPSPSGSSHQPAPSGPSLQSAGRPPYRPGIGPTVQHSTGVVPPSPRGSAPQPAPYDPSLQSAGSSNRRRVGTTVERRQAVVDPPWLRDPHWPSAYSLRRRTSSTSSLWSTTSMVIRPSRAVANRRISYSPECTACKMEIGVSDEEAVQTPCRHVYHAECMLMLVKTAVATTTLFPPRCCGQTIPTPLFEPYMTPGLKDALTAREAEQTTPRRVYCANSPCSRFLGAQDDVLPVKLYSCNAPGCSTRTCARCRSAVDGCILPEAHVCAEDPACEETLHLGKRMGWTRCPRCTELIERKSGCPHMTCRCGGEFCYVCGELYSKCTCGSRSRAQDRGDATRRERGYFAPGHLEDLQRYLALPIELTDSDEA